MNNAFNEWTPNMISKSADRMLSIVVPVYNVSQYLADCLKSILSQTFQDYEVILVDDGSTDDSGIQCDAFAASDERVLVIHQQNQGLSAARNAGIRLAKGKYICFIDSDDEYGTTTVLEDNLKILKKYPDADFLQFPHAHCQDGAETVWYFNKDAICEGNAAVFENCGMGVISSMTVWDKIFKRTIFDQCLFPEGRFFEDAWFLYDILPKCHQVVCTSKGYYRYRIRENSILHQSFSFKKCCDQIEVWLHIMDQIPSIAKESRLYTNVFCLYENYLITYTLTYDYKRFQKYFSEIDKRCPSWRCLPYCPKASDRAKLIVVCMGGGNWLLRLIHLKCKLLGRTH
jgi:glycosyltransferase involved in cell wall biosynthesis